MDEAVVASRHIAPMLIAAGRRSATLMRRVAGGLKGRGNIARHARPSQALAAMATGRTERPRLHLDRRAILLAAAALVVAAAGIFVSGTVLLDITGEWRAKAALNAALAKADASPDMALARMRFDFARSDLDSIRESGMASDDPVNSLALRQLYDQRLVGAWQLEQRAEQDRVDLAMSYLSNGKLRLIAESVPEFAETAEAELCRRRSDGDR